MKILMISSDPKILEDSEAAKRIEEYRKLVDELHIVVIAGRYNIVAFFRAYREGSRILRERWISDFLITAQDPPERWLVGLLLARRFHVPLEVQIHTDLRSPYFLKESVKNRIRSVIARFILPRAVCIRVVSRRIQRSLADWLPALSLTSTVLPVYVDVEKLRALHRIEEHGVFRFLMVSRFTREKNVALAIDVFAEIHADFPQTKLVLVGDGSERRRLEAQAVSCGLSKDVIIFAGWEENVSRRYEYADCYLLTSNYEGYGRTVVEALAVGVPVIMTDMGIAGEVVKHEQSGLVVPVGNKAELVKAMRRFLTDSYLRRILYENGRAAVRSYPTKEVYMEAYKNMWHACGTKKG